MVLFHFPILNVGNITAYYIAFILSKFFYLNKDEDRSICLVVEIIIITNYPR